MSPPSTSSDASSTVTPQRSAPSSIAQSSDDGPRSPTGPGCTIRQRCRLVIEGGMIAFSIGQTISSGWWRATAASISRAVETTATEISWPSSERAIWVRWLRLLWAETRKRMRIAGTTPCACALFRRVRESPRRGLAIRGAAVSSGLEAESDDARREEDRPHRDVLHALEEHVAERLLAEAVVVEAVVDPVRVRRFAAVALGVPDVAGSA